MSVSAVLTISTHGMQDNARRLGQATQAIANGSTTSVASTAIDDSGNLSGELLDVITADHGFAANASVFETGADMWQVLMTIVKD